MHFNYSEERNWYWVDKTVLNYTYWKEGEPNANDNQYYCGQIWWSNDNDGHWDDTQCNKAKISICKKEKGTKMN